MNCFKGFRRSFLGMDGEIVTPLGLGMGHIMIEEAAKVKRLPRNNLRADFSRSLLNNMERTHPLFISIEACDVEVQPIGGEFIPEVSRGEIGLAIKEFSFLEGVNRFDITLPGVSFGRNVVVP